MNRKSFSGGSVVFSMLLTISVSAQAGINTAPVNDIDNRLGSDATETEISTYTKLDHYGNALPDSAIRWECVRDNRTGLVWEVGHEMSDASQGDGYTWDESQQIAGLFNSDSLCGVSNWRLPSKDELLTIVDSARDGVKIDTRYFPDTRNGFYWSSTTYNENNNGAWLVYFSLGKEFVGNKQISYYARVVSVNH